MALSVRLSSKTQSPLSHSDAQSFCNRASASQCRETLFHGQPIPVPVQRRSLGFQKRQTSCTNNRLIRSGGIKLCRHLETKALLKSSQPPPTISGRQLTLRATRGTKVACSSAHASVSEGSDVSAESADTNRQEDVDGSILTGDGSYLADTRELVEVAMLAATAGLAYVLSNLLRLEGYFSSFFPLPLVVAAIRGNVRAAVKTMVATALLLLVLSGPLRAILYVISYGSLGLAMGAGWRLRIKWPQSVLLISLVRVGSLIASLALSSWLFRENIPRLILTQFHASLTAMFHAVGLPVGPGMGTVVAIASFALFFNSASYVFLLHILYSILLRRLGLQTATAAPSWVVKAGQGPKAAR